MSIDAVADYSHAECKAPNKWIEDPSSLLSNNGWQEFAHPSRFRAIPTSPDELFDINGFPLTADPGHLIVRDVITDKPVALLDEANLDRLFIGESEGVLQYRNPIKVLPLSMICDAPTDVVGLKTHDWYEAGSAANDSVIQLPTGHFSMWGNERIKEEFGITIKSSGQ